ncbi:cation:proton antiporter family protein [Gammaproteobacteria bacterium AB-CW1]|uniref:Cation:proton antiporter family protein n=1 Tax=Natronospira elongata TaxID=3110268 RepID=A0AAP6JF59_9GAMM|nr:cation:proton antiporter family protein [Gammaproteobacteria bacterium AB-CW1]
METEFFDIAILLALAVGIGGLAMLLRQPLIVAFIAAGIIAGPAVTGLVPHPGDIELLAELGIALLLFVVGLKLDLSLIRTMGPVALATGMGQVIFTSVVGYFIAIALGMSPVTALYVAVALTFSSTIIIVKLLSDKREIDALHGRIAIGFLIVQDIVVVMVMIGLSAFGAGTDTEGPWMEALRVLGAGIVMLLGVAIAMRYILPRLMEMIARNRELLVLFGIAWAVTLAAVGDAMGFSMEVGAFLAGISLASTRFRDALGARLTTVRDFLLLFFFLHLGSQLELDLLGAQVGPALILSAFVLIGNPIIVMIIMGFMGYRSRTGFLAGLTVAQISEFSLILAALGYSLGHITAETVGLVTLVGLITIGLSTYLIIYSHPIYDRIAPWLRIFERERMPQQDQDSQKEAAVDVIVCGLGRFGYDLAMKLSDRDIQVLGVDFDPSAVDGLLAEEVRACYGDAEDPELAERLPLSHARMVISTIPDPVANRALLDSLRHGGFQGRIMLTAHHPADIRALADLPEHELLLPFRDAASRTAERVAEGLRSKGG